MAQKPQEYTYLGGISSSILACASDILLKERDGAKFEVDDSQLVKLYSIHREERTYPARYLDC